MRKKLTKRFPVINKRLFICSLLFSLNFLLWAFIILKASKQGRLAEGRKEKKEKKEKRKERRNEGSKPMTKVLPLIPFHANPYLVSQPAHYLGTSLHVYPRKPKNHTTVPAFDLNVLLHTLNITTWQPSLEVSSGFPFSAREISASLF